MCRHLIVLITMLLSLRAYSQAPGCSRVDLRNNSVLGPVWNQGNVGSCASYTAADLLSYHLQRRLSPLALHLGFHRFQPNALVANGADVPAIVEMGLQGYMCLESRLSSRQFGTREYMQWSAAIVEMRRNIARNRQCTQAGLDALHHIFPSLTMEQLTNMSLYARDDQYLDNMRAASCGGDRPHFRVRPFVRRAPANYENIDRQLDATKPMILRYSSTVLRQPDPNYNGNDKGGHASMIVGRRFNPRTNQCEYLVRNTWGPGCASYAPNECENGNIWIRRDALMRRSSEITYLD